MRPPSFRADADEDIHAMALQQAGLWTAGDSMGRAVRRARHHLPHAPLLPASTAAANLLAVLPRAFATALGFFLALAGRVRDGHVGGGAGVGAVVPLVLEASELSVADVDTDVPGSALHDASRRWTGMATSRMARRSR